MKYSKDGTLVIDRKKKPWTHEETKKHISSQVENGSVTATTGEVSPIKADFLDWY